MRVSWDIYLYVSPQDQRALSIFIDNVHTWFVAAYLTFTPDIYRYLPNIHTCFVVTCPNFTPDLLWSTQHSHLICSDLPNINTCYCVACQTFTTDLLSPAQILHLICCHLICCDLPSYYTWFVVTCLTFTRDFTPDLLWHAWHSHMICCHLSDIHTWYVVTCLTFTHNMLSPARHLHLISWALADYNDIFYMLPMGEAYSRRFVRPSGTLSSKKL